MKEQFIASVSSVETPYFCVVDSDDYVLPKHLETLKAGMDRAKHECLGVGRKLAVGTPFIIKSVYFLPRMLIRGGWVRFLYERIEPQLVPNLFAGHNRKCGLDRCVDENHCWYRIYLSGKTKPTYIYRRKVAYHISYRVQRGLSMHQPKGKFKELRPQRHFCNKEIPYINDELPKAPFRSEQSKGLRWKT